MMKIRTQEQLNTPLNKRVDVADVLRGVAVMGIVILHSIEHFNFYSFPDTAGQCQLLNFTDTAIWGSLFFLFGGKAYAIFALLFGFSFFIQDDNQRRKGKDFRGRFMWRMALLFVIGNFNAMFFTGEILVMYSLIGFTMVLVCRLPDRAIFWIAVVLLLQPLEWGKFITALMHPEAVPAPGLASYYFREAAIVQAGGNFWQMAKTNLWEGQLASLTWAWEHGRIFQTAGLFMVGMLLGRRQLFLHTEHNLKFWFRVLCIALVCYFPLSGLLGMLPDWLANQAAWKSLKLILQSLANFSFMLLLVSGIILLFYTTRMEKPLLKLAPYGRMSLTNYITQSIVGSMLFYNWGLALHDDLGITYSALLGIGLFILQLAFCRWWMKNHQHGPIEYLWKKATWIGSK